MNLTSGKLFVDCQVFQYNAWSRGMGRYTLKLLAALDEYGLELTLLFNSALNLENDRLQAINESCPSAKIQFVELSTNPNSTGGWLELQEQCSQELTRQLKHLIQPTDTYLIASNFALGYCSVFPTLKCNKALLFYDLTPYLQWHDYGQSIDFEPHKYFAQFKTAFDADQLWAISQSAADEAQQWLGINPDKISNIRGASIRNLNEPDRKPSSVAVSDKFLLCPSADSPHKNNELMVRSFAAFNAEQGGGYKLVITSGFTDQSIAQLNELSPDIIFCGHVSDGELSWLYKHCQAMLFVSKNEGLGLPILEAVAANKKIICSDIGVFKEISQNAFYFADPASELSILSALNAALSTDSDWAKKQQVYTEINAIYDWSAVAKTCALLMHKPSIDQANYMYESLIFVDNDGESVARDIAEIWYAEHAFKKITALRIANYTHRAPSYLVEMGVAEELLVGSNEGIQQPVYVIDDSEQSGILLLYALTNPGFIVMNYSESQTPKLIEAYLQKTFGETMSYTAYSELLRLRGNHTQYVTMSSPRGSIEFLDEAAKLLTKTLKV